MGNLVSLLWCNGREIENGLEKARKELEVIKQSADAVSEYSDSIINIVREPLIILNQDLRVVTASRSFYEVFKVKPEETVGQLIYDLGNKQWDIPRLRELLETILPEKATFDNYEVEHDFADIGRRIMLLNARQIERASGKERIILLAIEDITERKQTEDALRQSEEKYRTILENMQEGYFELDLAGNYTFVNDAGCRNIGYHREELIGMNNRQYQDETTAQKTYQLFRRLYRTGAQVKAVDVEIIRKNGTKGFNEVSVSFIRDSEGKPIGFRGISRDITDRKRAEEALRASEENFRRSLDESPQGVRIISKEGETLYANRAILDIFGYDSIEELQTTPTVKRYTEQSYAAFKVRREERRLGKDNSPEYRIDIVRKDGEVRHLQVWRKRVLWNGKEHYQVIYCDITDRKLAEEALKNSESRYRALSIVDDLTQLYNSRHFYFQLKIELDRSNRYGQPLTLLLLDLDNFKAFNDAYGHVEGDQVLWRLGHVVKRCLRETDFAYRYGGEEFTILLPMTTSVDGAVTAERIRAEIQKENFSPAPGQDVHVTVSIGLAQYKPQEDIKAFVHRVDQLMYQGKKNGKDRVCCEL
jgi:diguanylate cyclase (GGDEF)-like protein/PAS domain S-box-containing protein